LDERKRKKVTKSIEVDWNICIGFLGLRIRIPLYLDQDCPYMFQLLQFQSLIPSCITYR